MNLQQLTENKNWSKANIVFTNDNFKGQEYTETERTYTVSSSAKYFDGSKIGTSLFGDCLDGRDLGIRLDWYNWKVERIDIIE